MSGSEGMKGCMVIAVCGCGEKLPFHTHSVPHGKLRWPSHLSWIHSDTCTAESPMLNIGKSNKLLLSSVFTNLLKPLILISILGK